jgi:hypothetical protein
MAKVLVVGAGPAGLAAAERILDEGNGAVQVTLLTLGHHLGGKACSWVTPDKRVVEHGQHVMLGFYDEMRALLRRSGVDPAATSVSNEGRFTVFEDRDQRAHDLHLGESTLRTFIDGIRYSGWSLGEKAGFAQMFARGLPNVVPGVSESLDDICLTAWCLEKGLPLSITGTNVFRASREAQLNWPGEISAYAMLKTIRIAGRDYQSAEARFPAGGMSNIWWRPIVERIEAMGGEIKRLHKLVGIRHESGRLTGLEFATPLPHNPGERYVDGPVPTAPGTEVLFEDFDAAILTLPAPALAMVLAKDPTLNELPGLSGVQHITSVAPLGLHVWHKAAVTAKHRTVVAGLEPPLGFVLDNKPHYPEYRDDPAYGACLHFVGQETGYDDDDDETLLERALESVRKVPGYERMTREGVITFEVVRNRAPHKRYWNAEPGSLKHKPRPKTPIDGLFLAGDWVRSELDFPCMENAIRSGREAAGLTLQQLGRGRHAA